MTCDSFLTLMAYWNVCLWIPVFENFSVLISNVVNTERETKALWGILNNFYESKGVLNQNIWDLLGDCNLERVTVKMATWQDLENHHCNLAATQGHPLHPSNLPPGPPIGQTPLKARVQGWLFSEAQIRVEKSEYEGANGKHAHIWILEGNLKDKTEGKQGSFKMGSGEKTSKQLLISFFLIRV